MKCVFIPHRVMRVFTAIGIFYVSQYAPVFSQFLSDIIDVTLNRRPTPMYLHTQIFLCLNNREIAPLTIILRFKSSSFTL